MLRKFAAFSILTIFFSFCLISGSILHTSADIADMYSLDVGGTFSNSSYLTMSEVDTHVRIVKDSTNIKVTVLSNFYIKSNITINASLAFVYPKEWSMYYTPPQLEFTVKLDNFIVNYTVESYENLTSNGFNVNSTDYGGTWVTHAEFVLFNADMIENQTHHIAVETTAFPMTNHYGSFSYIVGSAKTFSGSTHQIIEMLVIEEEPFLSFSFLPEEFLVESSNETGTIATWDLTIDDSCNINTVSFHFTENEYYGNPPPIPFPYAVYATLGIIIVMIGAGLVIRRRRVG